MKPFLSLFFLLTWATSMSLTSAAISCANCTTTSNGTIYTAPNSKQYKVECQWDHTILDIGNIARSWQPTYEMCAQFCSGRDDCLTFSWIPNEVWATNCYLKNYTGGGAYIPEVWGGIVTPVPDVVPPPPPSTSSAPPASTETASNPTTIVTVNPTITLLTTTVTGTPSPSSSPVSLVRIFWYTDPQDFYCAWAFLGHTPANATSDSDIADICQEFLERYAFANCTASAGLVPGMPASINVTFSPFGLTGCVFTPGAGLMEMSRWEEMMRVDMREQFCSNGTGTGSGSSVTSGDHDVMGMDMKERRGTITGSKGVVRYQLLDDVKGLMNAGEGDDGGTLACNQGTFPCFLDPQANDLVLCERGAFVPRVVCPVTSVKS